MSKKNDPIISVKNLTKKFDKLTAVNKISFDIERGTTTAILGPNGAGKTTTIAMLLGLLIPTTGSITILGADMLKNKYAVLPRINFSSPYVDLPHSLTVKENLTVYGHLYSLKNIPQRIAELSKDLNLEDLLSRKTGRLSAGQKTRVSIAKAMINKPEILLLDEPTASLDPDTADWLRTHLETYQKKTGATILLASHNMAEVERMAHMVLMMKQGKITDRGTPKALIKKFGRSTLEEVFLHIARDEAAA
jgi:ABC-2 type transport system ATP-binding protein